MMQTMIPLRMMDRVNRELEPDESIQWIDMPIPSFFTPKAAAAFLFAIPWTAFSVFWICGAARFTIPDFTHGFDFFPLFGVPFFLIGLGLLSSPFWAYRNAFKTVYVITDKRAITIVGGYNTTIRSYPPEKLLEIYRVEKSNGTGDLVFDKKTWRDSDGDKHTEPLGFLRIRDPKSVEQILRLLAGRKVHD